MNDSRYSSLDDNYPEYLYPEDRIRYEPEDPDEVLAFVRTIAQELIERVIPEPKRVLTLEKAGECLSVLGKIWNLTECPEGCEIDSVKCETSDERLLDMEGYVDEYQYLNLEAADLALSDIRIIPEHFIWLLTVDVSGNRLDNVSACPLTKLQNLVSVKINRNRIADPYLNPMKHLQYLGMNSNKIESLHRIYHPNLAVLDLKWNKIRDIDPNDCWKLVKLKQLELRGNFLKTTAGLRYENLETLYLAENEITAIEGMEFLPALRRLHLRGNPLSALSGFGKSNGRLEYLNIRSCRVEEIDELRQLQVLEGLKVLIVKGNPFDRSDEAQDEDEDVGQEDDDIRLRVLTLLPRLKRINKRVVTRSEMLNARDTLDERELT